LTAGGRVRWQDAPEVALYQLGIDSSARRALYGERKIELSGFTMLRPTPNTRFVAAIAAEHYVTDGGRLDAGEDEALLTLPVVPGLASHTTFVHSGFAGGFDSRPAGDISHRGSLLQAGVQHYADQTSGRYSFAQFVAEGEHVMAVAAGHGAVDVAARAWLSANGSGDIVPLYLMPYLGGGDFLRGYKTYRFRDRHALLLTAEFRWTVHRYIEAVAFSDAGTVAPRIADLTFGSMRPTAGAGIRAHAAKDTLFRVDLAGGRDGLQLLIGFSSRPSAIF